MSAKKDKDDKKDKSPECGEVESDCAQMRSTSTSSRSVGEANASSQPCPATASPTTQGRVALMPAVRLRASARILPLLKWSWYGPAVAKPGQWCHRSQEPRAGGSCKKGDGLMILLLVVEKRRATMISA